MATESTAPASEIWKYFDVDERDALMGKRKKNFQMGKTRSNLFLRCWGSVREILTDRKIDNTKTASFYKTVQISMQRIVTKL